MKIKDIIKLAFFPLPIVWEKLQELFGDPNADTVIFLGPTQSGKTELLAALAGEEFNCNRLPTGINEGNKVIRFGEKELFVFDSAGQENIYDKSLSAILQSLKRRDCRNVLLVLVVDISKYSSVEQILGNDPSDLASSGIGDYLQFMSSKCERITNGEAIGDLEKSCQKIIKDTYMKGRWAYTLVGTHVASANQSQIQLLGNAFTALHRWQGRMRALGMNKFELNPEVKGFFGSHDKAKEVEKRKQIVSDVQSWLKGLFEELHK